MVVVVARSPVVVAVLTLVVVAPVAGCVASVTACRCLCSAPSRTAPLMKNLDVDSAWRAGSTSKECGPVGSSLNRPVTRSQPSRP